MADNYTTDAGAGGNTYRSDDIGGVHWPYVKLAWGSDGTGTICDATHALPVDLISLPAGNLGQQAMAASLSVVPASDIADATYIGDIKFGEALPAGTNLLGKVGIDQTTPGTTNAVAPISGQAGVAGGTGVMDATVQRVTLATDDPAVVDLAAIEVLLGTIDADTSNITACNTGAVVIASGTVDTVTTVTTVASVTAIANALPAGTNLLGKVGIDQTTPGTTNAVAPISGQAGVAGGTGVMGADVQRVTLATDDPAVVDLAAIEVLLGTIDADTSNITACDTGAVVIASGTVDTVTTVTTVTSVTAIANALPAGTNLLGKVGIDQTTPGTTNAVAPISGQAGVAGGTGAMGATVQRVTLATDDPAVVDLAAIEVLLGTIDADTSNITACNTGAVVIASGTVDTVTTVTTVTAIANALPAGTNLLGKVGLDWGTALVGNVGIDQTTPGTTNAVAPISGQAGIAGGTGVDGATVPRVTLATNVGLPAGAAEVGFVGAAGQSDYAYDGAAKCTLKEFMVVGTVAGNNTLVAAVGAKKIRLLHLEMIALSATANTVYVVNDDYPLIATAANPIPIAADADGDNHGGFVTGPGWRRTTDTVNEAVVAVQSATAAILYMGTYIEVA